MSCPKTVSQRVAYVGAGLLVAVFLLVGCTSAPLGATVIETHGSLDAHDPALTIDDLGTADPKDDVWYVYATGDGGKWQGAPQVRRSVDHGSTWENIGPAWDSNSQPTWARAIIDGITNFWAPELYEHDGTYYLYYSASTFGSNSSLIGLYTNSTLDPDSPEYAWEDKGEVLRSDAKSPFNAIDPGIIEDEEGAPWMVYGSFWNGLFMVPLEWPSGKLLGRAQTIKDPLAESEITPIQVADRGFPPNAIEAGYITERDGWFYLFFSRDSCCQGTHSTYNIAVGRSKTVTGPYVDADGIPLLKNGGTQVLETKDHMIGPGGQSVAKVGSEYVLAFHYYDGSTAGQARLALRKLGWTKDGWPQARLGHE